MIVTIPGRYIVAEEAAKRAKEAAEKRVKEAAEKAAKYIKKKKTKAKPTEEKSFAQFAKKCEAEGLLESKPPEESSKDESKAKGSRTASPLPANFNPEANLSNMSKEQADKHQEEMLTWQDRWHQNKKVSQLAMKFQMCSSALKKFSHSFSWPRTGVIRFVVSLSIP